jgi:hypothetical protein
MSAHRLLNGRSGRRPLGLLLLAGTTLALALTGCEDQETADRVAALQAAEESDRILEQVHSHGHAPAAAATREQAYEQAIRTLSEDAGKGLDIQQCALNGLMARAHAGLTDLRSYEILDLERRAAAVAERLRQTAVAIERVQQNAELLSNYDPTAERQMIEDQRRATNTELATLRQQERRLAAQLDQVRGEAGQHRASYENFRLQADEIRSEVERTAGAANRHTLVEQAAGLQGQADSQEKQFAELTAEVDSLQPELERIRELISHGEEYLQILRQAESDVEGRLLRRQEAAADQQELAGFFVDQAGELYSELMNLAETNLNTAYGEALEEAERALRSARTARSKAPSDARDALATSLARYQQALGQLQWQHARSLDANVRTLELLSELAVLPEQDALVANIDRMLSTRDDLLTAATEAYGEALDTLDGVRGDQVLQGTVSGLRTQLWRIRAVTSGGEFPAEEMTTDLAADPGMEGDLALAGASDASSPLDALFEALESLAVDDFEAAAALIYTDDSDAQYVIDTWMDAARRVARLDEACLDIFDMTLSECWEAYADEDAQLTESDEARRAGDASLRDAMQPALGELDGGLPMAEDFEVVIQDDIATVTHLATGAEIRMILVNQAWFIYQDPAPAALVQMQDRIDEAADRTLRYPQIAGQLESGEIGTIEELIEAIRTQ